MRAARETPSTCAALSQGARPLARRIFQFNIQRLFSSAHISYRSEYRHWKTRRQHSYLVTKTINNCVRINPSPGADMRWCATYRGRRGIIDTMLICLSPLPGLINLIIKTCSAMRSETLSLKFNSIFHAGVSSGRVHTIVFLKAFASFVREWCLLMFIAWSEVWGRLFRLMLVSNIKVKH